MGCDIHGWIERKTETGDWRRVLQLCAGRHYALFGGLAGVRCPEYEIIAPKGTPPDADTRENDYDLGDHSYSWLTLKELERVRYHLGANGVFSNELDAWIAAIEKLGEARIVFGFDS